ERRPIGSGADKDVQHLVGCRPIGNVAAVVELFARRRALGPGAGDHGVGVGRPSALIVIAIELGLGVVQKDRIACRHGSAATAAISIITSGSASDDTSTMTHA